MQASSTQNLSDDSVYNDEENSASSYDGEEPRSLARVSCQTMESRSHDERVQPDYMLAAKAHVLTLLAAGVQGETVKELGVSQNYIAVDEETRSKIEEAQKMLGYTLKKLVELRQISSDEGQEVLTAIFYVSFLKQHICLVINYFNFRMSAMIVNTAKDSKSAKNIMIGC